MTFVNVQEKGTLFVFFKFHTDLKSRLLTICDTYNLSYQINQYTVSLSFQHITELNSILSIFSKELQHHEKKQLLVSFERENATEVLNDIVSLYALIQSHLHGEVVELIKSGELYSIMQPIYDIQNKKIYGYEFLLRGRIDDKIIPPIEIFETANEVGLQHLLDSRARDLSIKKASTLLEQDLRIFINFLPSSICNKEYNLTNTFETANDYDVSLSRLVFELVETENLNNINELNSEFFAYKENGTTLAIDDVGAGYSSLNKLHQLVPDYVKLDRELVSHCDTNTEKFRIMKSIVDLCNNLNILILAEGIERKEELQVCMDLGVHLGQGYLLGKPSEFAVNECYFEQEKKA